MNDEKQIEEMASRIPVKISVYNMKENSEWLDEDKRKLVAVIMYNEGFRLQKRGEWDESVPFCNKCSLCDAIVERYAVKNRHGRLNFCPNCGAKMGGGAG